MGEANFYVISQSNPASPGLPPQSRLLQHLPFRTHFRKSRFSLVRRLLEWELIFKPIDYSFVALKLFRISFNWTWLCVAARFLFSDEVLLLTLFVYCFLNQSREALESCMVALSKSVKGSRRLVSFGLFFSKFRCHHNLPHTLNIAICRLLRGF